MCLFGVTAEEITAWGTVVVAIGTLILALVAWRQLGGLNESAKTNNELLRINGLLAVLQLESEMNDRKETFDAAALAVREAHAHNRPIDDLLQTRLTTARENYFNAVDRMAYIILHKYLEERDWKAEYRTYLSNIVNESIDCFQANTPYRNILDLNNKWSRE